MTINTETNLSKVLNIDTFKNTKYTFMFLMNGFIGVHHLHRTNPLLEVSAPAGLTTYSPCFMSPLVTEWNYKYIGRDVAFTGSFSCSIVHVWHDIKQ